MPITTPSVQLIAKCFMYQVHCSPKEREEGRRVLVNVWSRVLQKKRRKFLSYSIFHFLWYKYFHHG